MKVTLQSTAESIHSSDPMFATSTAVRVWRGTTERGTPIVAFVIGMGCADVNKAAFLDELAAIGGDAVMTHSDMRVPVTSEIADALRKEPPS